MKFREGFWYFLSTIIYVGLSMFLIFSMLSIVLWLVREDKAELGIIVSIWALPFWAHFFLRTNSLAEALTEYLAVIFNIKSDEVN